MNIGVAPTIRNEDVAIEAFLLDFEGDLYGDLVRVEFLARLRGVRPFASASELVEQMKWDRAAAVEYFERGEGRLYMGGGAE